VLPWPGLLKVSVIPAIAHANETTASRFGFILVALPYVDWKGFASQASPVCGFTSDLPDKSPALRRLRTAARGTDTALSRSRPGLRVGKLAYTEQGRALLGAAWLDRNPGQRRACVDHARQAPPLCASVPGCTVRNHGQLPSANSAQEQNPFGVCLVADTMRVRTRLHTLGPATRTLMVNTVARPRRFPSTGEVGQLLTT
jgi:hypothetical protein